MYKQKILETLKTLEKPIPAQELALLIGAAKKVEVISFEESKEEFEFKKQLWDLLSAGEINLTGKWELEITKELVPGTVEC
jgi:hypothetical protein